MAHSIDISAMGWAPYGVVAAEIPAIATAAIVDGAFIDIDASWRGAFIVATDPVEAVARNRH